jgi:hypothetical protein
MFIAVVKPEKNNEPLKRHGVQVTSHVCDVIVLIFYDLQAIA